MYQRKQVSIIEERIHEAGNPFMQVVVGARQTGKSTMIAQALKNSGVKHHSVSADDLLSPDARWIQTEWQQARNMKMHSGSPVVLVLDEVQKVREWPNVVKGLWDADQRNGLGLKVILSGSSSLLLRKGLEDSLKGRFEIIRSPHWSFAECRDAFRFDLNDFLYFGGFPGAARLAKDERRWRSYMRDSIIEPTISKDVLEDEDVRKPALMRALFELGARFSSQELSYAKMVGQLQDAGNTTTVAHYLDLLDKACVLKAIEKYHPNAVRRKRSTPRLAVYDTSLMTSAYGMPKEAMFLDSSLRGHLVESAVGAYLLARAPEEGFEVSWWRDGGDEVDFVVDTPRGAYAIEVKSGRTKSQGGMAAFLERYPEATRVVVGGSASGAFTLEDFLLGSCSFD